MWPHRGSPDVCLLCLTARSISINGVLANPPPSGAVPPAGLRPALLYHRRQGEDRVGRREHTHPPLARHGREAVGGDLGADAGGRGAHLQHPALPPAAARCVRKLKVLRMLTPEAFQDQKQKSDARKKHPENSWNGLIV